MAAAKKTYAVGDVVTLKSKNTATLTTPDGLKMSLSPKNGVVRFVGYSAGDYTVNIDGEPQTVTVV